ncbi:MAG TPA: arsenical resistance operon transcriptional repressor ArsD [Bacillus bacterium]|nr:arsenical resistance operon transcriptional repressor ArsD [Bacillus sp. (in: firmicutes)]
MKTIKIFDPAMCCPTGVCGPSVDPELTRVASTIFLLEKKGFSIDRYNLGNDPSAFVENLEVNRCLHEKGTEALPLVMVDGKVEKVGSYPSNQEFANWLGVDVKELSPEKPRNQLL